MIGDNVFLDAVLEGMNASAAHDIANRFLDAVGSKNRFLKTFLVFGISNFINDVM
jgi:hypothetical protein